MPDGCLSSELQLGLACFPVVSRPHGRNVGEDVSQLLGRFQALRQLKHPYLCRHLELIVGRDRRALLATEHASLTLAAALAAHPEGFGDQFAARAVAQVVSALCHLSVHGLTHGHLDSEHVIVSEDGSLKLTGHGLGHLTEHGRLADFTLHAHGQYLPPELAPDLIQDNSDSVPGDSVNRSAATTVNVGRTCKPDVWSLGIMTLELVNGLWRPECVGTGDEVMALETSVKFCTACVLKRFVDSTPDCGSLSVATLLGNTSDVDAEVARGLELPLASGFDVARLQAEQRLEALEGSYRRWLGSRVGSSGGQDLCDFWVACLTPEPTFRPPPGDLATHPALASEVPRPSSGSAGLRWTSYPALQSERLASGHSQLDDRREADRRPMERMREYGMEIEHLHYWWSLAGGNAFAVLAELHLLRPMPSILQLPLYVRDRGEDGMDSDTISFFGACSDSKDAGDANGADARADVREEVGAAVTGQQPRVAEAAASVRGLWGPQGGHRPRTIGVDLRDLCTSIAEVERHGIGAAKEMRPVSLHDRQHHFGYQWLRVRHFQRLLLTLPKSRPEIFREAGEDVPPLLRAQVWAAIFGADCDSDFGCWLPFYERLVASPLARGEEDKKTAMRACLSHELLSNPPGMRKLERLVHAALKANPCLTRVDGLAALAAPISILFCANEPAAFLFFQRVLHGFLWNYYAQESDMHRRHVVHLFSALLRFVDPQLEIHLQAMGMQPDIYAGTWFPTWFAQLLPLNQLLLLWDAILLRPPQFPLFIGVCLLHLFRRSLLATDDVSHASNFLASMAQLVDVTVLIHASLALFQAVPASVTLPLFPRHSAGDALLSGPGVGAAPAAVDPQWSEERWCRAAAEGGRVGGERGEGDAEEEGGPEQEDPTASAARDAREQLAQRATAQWRQCEWWRQRAAGALTPPIITVDDLLSFRSRCFVLDVRSAEAFAEGHFQGSSHVRDSEEGDLGSVVPQEVLSLGGTPGDREEEEEDGEEESAATPWLFAFNPNDALAPVLRVRLVVVVGGGEDFGADFAERLLCAGVRHVVCLLGGATALKADAPSYLTKE